MRRTLRIRRSSAVRGQAFRSLVLALPALPDSIRKIRLGIEVILVTDLRVEVQELYLIKVFRTRLRAKEIFRQQGYHLSLPQK